MGILCKFDFICPYCGKNIARLFGESKNLKHIICLNCGKHYELKEIKEVK